MDIKLTSSNSPAQLQRVFESAVPQGRAQRRSGHEALWYRTPIGHRANKALRSSVDSEKRKLSSAAQALAQLWNIAPSRGR
jgi:hypothetical protein